MELNFINVNKTYGNFSAVKNINLSLKNGIYGLLGPNGAGKTTTINMLAGIIRPTKGIITCDGVDIQNLSKEYRAKIGYMPQSPCFYNNFSVREFMYFMCEIKGIPRKKAIYRSKELIEAFNLSECMSKKIGKLSGGMRQRLGIAQAMLNDPELLILDEPTSGLDPLERIRFRKIISNISKNRIVLLATHIVSDVEYIAENVIFMNKGEIIINDTPQKVLSILTGKTFLIRCSTDNIDKYSASYKITNIQNKKTECEIKVISDTPILNDQNWEPVQPTLEDVFLHFFG